VPQEMLEMTVKLVEKLIELTSQEKLKWEMVELRYCNSEYSVFSDGLGQWRIVVRQIDWGYKPDLSAYEPIQYSLDVYDMRNQTSTSYGSIPEMFRLFYAIMRQGRKQKENEQEKNAYKPMTSQEEQECVSKLLKFAQKL